MENLNFYNLKDDTVLEDKEIIENLVAPFQKKLILSTYMMRLDQNF